MTENKKANKKHAIAKKGALFLAWATTLYGALNYQAKKMQPKIDKADQDQRDKVVEISTLKQQLFKANERAEKAEKLNQQAWTVLADATPSYTLTGEGEDPQTKRENAAEKKRYEKACKELGINPQKLLKLHKELLK